MDCNGATTCIVICKSGNKACGGEGRVELDCSTSACLLDCQSTCGPNGGNFIVTTIPSTQSYQCNGACGNVPAPEFTADPLKAPSESPSQSPTTLDPTTSPSTDPTQHPSESPTKSPSEEPTKAPSEEPSATPSSIPSQNPSSLPSDIPTGAPSEQPSMNPSSYPSQAPTPPTLTPSRSPLAFEETFPPTKYPTGGPTTPQPTMQGIADTPTTSPNIPGTGSVGDIPTIASNLGNNQPATAGSKDGLEDCIYVVIGCGSMICCLIGLYMIKCFSDPSFTKTFDFVHNNIYK